MREVTLKEFFLGAKSAMDLDDHVSGSVVHLSPISSTVQIEDMDEEFELVREHVLRLCDAGLQNFLSAESLNTIAFALMASDTFWWEDDVVSEVIADWSAPEVNFPLTHATLTMHREWLSGVAAPVERPRPARSGPGRLVSRRKKVNGRTSSRRRE